MRKWLSVALALLIAGCVRPLPSPAPIPVPPVPIVAPIVTAPLRVLIVKDNATLNRLPPAQFVAVMSGSVRDYCKTHCQMGPDGKTPEFRTYEWDTDTQAQSQAIQEAFAEAVKSGKASGVPWLVVNNGAAGYSGPFPATEAEAIALLKKYGGE